LLNEKEKRHGKGKCARHHSEIEAQNFYVFCNRGVFGNIAIGLHLFSYIICIQLINSN
jgi:hypothetical protein